MKVLWCSLLVAAFVAGASACTNDETAAVDGKCRQFQICKNGEWVTDSCNTPLRKYSKEQKKCMWWFQVDCVEATQCSDENTLLKNPYTCSSYYECSGGKLVTHNCIWPFYFDGAKCKFWGNCQIGAAGDKYAEECKEDDAEPMADSTRLYKTCVDGFFVQTSCWMGQKFDVDTKSCQWFWKVKTDVTTCDGKPRSSDESDGKTYYQCDTDTGILLKKSCPFLQKFDSELGRCVMSLKSVSLNEVSGSLTSEEAAQAVKNIDELISTGEAEKNGTVSIKRVLRSISNLRDSSCTDGTYQTDMNCLNYKVCISNVWVTRTCPPGQIFSNGGCKWSWSAQCDAGSCVTGQASVYKPDCTKYYVCNENNQEILTSCSEGIVKRHFDPSSGTCKVVWWWTPCPSSYIQVCSEGQTSAGSVKGEYRLCSSGKWQTIQCTGSDVYKEDLHGCGCPKEAEHREAQNSKQYLECQEGRWIQLDCLLGGVFNPTTKVCEKTKSKRSVRAETPKDCVIGGTKADVTSGVCSTFMFCTTDGKWSRRACPAGEYYNGLNGCGKDLCLYTPVPGDCESFVMKDGVKGKCDFGFRFDSVTRECVLFANATCLAAQCEGRERKNHPTSCDMYLQCQDERWEVKKCGLFHNKFDMKARECVFGWWGNKASCRYDQAKCTEGMSTPVAGDCRQYVTCTDQREHEGSCAWPKKFDSSSSKCVWWGAKCG